MSDTSVDVEARFRELMLARSPEERLAMACGMFATAKALVRVGIVKEVGLEGPIQMREHLFLRLCGKDFPETEKEKILKSWKATGQSKHPNSSLASGSNPKYGYFTAENARTAEIEYWESIVPSACSAVNASVS